MILLALWIILGLILIVVLLSFMPFLVYVRLKPSLGAVNGNGGFGYQTILYWPWKIFGIEFGKDSQGNKIRLLLGNKCFYKREKQGEEKDSEKKEKKKKEEKERKRKGLGLKLLRDRALLRQLISAALKFLRDIISCIHRPQLAGDIEVGFSDPAAMGVISGFIYAISPKGMVLGELKIRPNYIDTIFYGELDFSTGVLPARVFGAFIKLLFHLPKRKLLGIIRHRRKTAKQEVN